MKMTLNKVVVTALTEVSTPLHKRFLEGHKFHQLVTVLRDGSSWMCSLPSSILDIKTNYFDDWFDNFL